MLRRKCVPGGSLNRGNVYIQCLFRATNLTTTGILAGILKLLTLSRRLKAIFLTLFFPHRLTFRVNLLEGESTGIGLFKR